MRLGTMLSDVLESLFSEPATQRYPYVRQDSPERLRGKLVWDPNKCTGCGLCAKDCPSDALEVIILDRAKKQFVVRYHLDRCTFCAQCVHNCRFKCLSMSSDEWELASTNKADFDFLYGDEGDIQTYRERQAGEQSGAAAG